MTATASALTLEDMAARFKAKPAGPERFEAHCPCHEDHNPSLSIFVGKDDRPHIECHAGCDFGSLCAVAGIKFRGGQFYPDDAVVSAAVTPRITPRRATKDTLGESTFAKAETDYHEWRRGRDKDITKVGEWQYADDFWVVRYEPKDYRPFHRGEDGRWRAGDPTGKLPLYNLPTMRAADPAVSVLVVEGERCVEAAKRIGHLVTTTSAHGSKSPHKTDWSPLAGRTVIIWPDKDDAGAKYAEQVTAILTSLDPPAKVRIIEPPAGLPDHGDIADWNGVADALQSLMDAAAPWSPKSRTKPKRSPPSKSDKLRRTDLGNMDRFAKRWGDRLRYCFQTGKWYVWVGLRWRPDDKGYVMRAAKKTIKDLYTGAWKLPADDDPEGIATHALKSANAQRLRAMVDLARSEKRIAVLAEDLDADPWALNCRNGILDLRTGRLRKHDPAELHTKLVPVDYEPDAQCPVFERFISETAYGSDALATYLQRLLGMCLAGDISEQILPVFWGVGSNGKSTLLDLILRIMGDYAGRAAPDLLVTSKWERHSCEIADLSGKRLVIASETEKHQHLRVQFVKQMTGDARLKARYMRQDFFEFDRQFKTVLVTNNKPVVDEQTHAIWRRLKLVPFLNIVPDGDQDKDLPGKLWQEAAGVLAWLVEGCLKWQRGGMKTPDEVTDATESYMAESNWLKQFTDECLNLVPGLSTPSSRITETFRTWCQENGHEPNMQDLWERLRQEGCRPKRKTKRRLWSGVIIAPPAPEGD